jgi:hypothetical protein
MLVHIGTDQAAIVLVRDWVPHLVHQVFTPHDGPSVGDYSGLVSPASHTPSADFL